MGHADVLRRLPRPNRATAPAPERLDIATTQTTSSTPPHARVVSAPPSPDDERARLSPSHLRSSTCVLPPAYLVVRASSCVHPPAYLHLRTPSRGDAEAPPPPAYLSLSSLSSRVALLLTRLFSLLLSDRIFLSTTTPRRSLQPPRPCALLYRAGETGSSRSGPRRGRRGARLKVMAAVDPRADITTSAQEEDDDGDDWGTKILVLKARHAPPAAPASHPPPHAPTPAPSLPSSLSPTSSRTPSARRG